jgi:hypothetical protein
MYIMKVTISSDRGTSPVINFIGCKHRGCLISLSVDLELVAINLMVFIAILLFLFHAIHTHHRGWYWNYIITHAHSPSQNIWARGHCSTTHTHDTTHAFFIQTSWQENSAPNAWALSRGGAGNSLWRLRVAAVFVLNGNIIGFHEWQNANQKSNQIVQWNVSFSKNFTNLELNVDSSQISLFSIYFYTKRILKMQCQV